MAVIYLDTAFRVTGQTLEPTGGTTIAAGSRGTRVRLSFDFDSDPWREYRGTSSATAKRRIGVMVERDGKEATSFLNTAIWATNVAHKSFTINANISGGKYTNEVFELLQAPGVAYVSVFGIDKTGEDARMLTTNKVRIDIVESLRQ